MGLTSTAVGASVGVVMKITMNSIRKLPLRREPWEYLILGGAGGYIGYKMPMWEAGLINDINEMRADRNMPPLEREGGIIFGGIIKDPKKSVKHENESK